MRPTSKTGMRTVPVAAALATAALGLAAPGVARAENLCVNAPYCDGTDYAAGQLQQALTDAGDNDSDVVVIGPATYTTASLDGFRYNGAGALRVVGAGSTKAILKSTAGDGATVLALVPLQGVSVSVESLGVELPAANGVTGADLSLGNGEASDLTVSPDAGASGTRGVFLRSGSLEDSHIAAGDGAAVVPSSTPSVKSLRGGTLSGRWGVYPVPTGSYAVSIRSLQIRATEAGVVALGPLNVFIADSLIRVAGSSVLNAALTASSGATIDGRALTIVGDGDGDGLASTNTLSASPTTLAIENSIVHGFGSVRQRTGGPGTPANMTIRYTNYDPTGSVDAGPGALTEQATTNLAPGFLDPTATLLSPGTNFRLRSDSPLIDAGDPAETLVDPDLDGLARVVDGNGDGVPRHDMGAYEYQPPPLPPQNPGPGGSPAQPGTGGATPDAVAPSISGLSLSNRVFGVRGRRARTVTAAGRRPAPKGTSFRFRLSEAAEVAIAIQRRTLGRRVGKRCRKATRSNRSRRRCARFVKLGSFPAAGQTGPNAVRFSGRMKLGRRSRSLEPAHYRASLSATDEAGNRSRTRRIGFQVVR